MTFEEPAGEKMTLPDGKRAVPVATRYGVVVTMTFVVGISAVSKLPNPPLFPAKKRYFPVPGDHWTSVQNHVFERVLEVHVIPSELVAAFELLTSPPPQIVINCPS